MTIVLRGSGCAGRGAAARRFTAFRTTRSGCSRAQDGHPSLSKSNCSRLPPRPPRACFSLSRCFFRFSIRTPARTADFIDVLYDFGSARGTRCVHIAMGIEPPVIIGCVRACGQILGIPLEIAFEHVPERCKLVSPGRHITRRMHNFRTHPVIPEPTSKAPLIERIAPLGSRPRPFWIRRQSGKEIMPSSVLFPELGSADVTRMRSAGIGLSCPHSLDPTHRRRALPRSVVSFDCREMRSTSYATVALRPQ